MTIEALNILSQSASSLSAKPKQSPRYSGFLSVAETYKSLPAWQGIRVNNDRDAATPEAPAKAGGSGLLKPAQFWPLMSPLSGGSILPVSLRCLTSIFTPPRLFNRVNVIELINLPVFSIPHASDWLPPPSRVFWLAADDPGGQPLLLWSVSAV